MNLSIIGCGLFTFVLSLGLHVILWRLKRPNQHALVLLVVFTVPVMFCLLGFKASNPSVRWEDIAAIFLLHLSLSFAYIQIYPASQAESPSLKLMRLVHQHMPQGMTEDAIMSQFDPRQLFSDRVEDLLKARLIQKEGDELRLTGKGKSLIGPFILIRKVMGIPPGKG